MTTYDIVHRATHKIIYMNDDGSPAELRDGEGDDETIGLDALQQLVGGNVEWLPIVYEGVLEMYFHSTGRYAEKPNVYVPLEGRGIFDIFGPIVFTSADAEGHTLGFSEERATELLGIINSWQRIILVGS